MKELAEEKVSPCYCAETEMLFWDDAFSVLKELRPLSVNMIFADPPYFLSDDGQLKDYNWRFCMKNQTVGKKFCKMKVSEFRWKKGGK